MKNSLGTSVIFTLFGESHGKYIGGVLDGLAPGIEIDHAYIRRALDRRRAKGKLSTSRDEKDPYQLISGIKIDDKTGKEYSTGAPITVLIPNLDVKSSDYKEKSHLFRPGHADYTAYKKYLGYQDSLGGGHFSGRLTAPLVVLGSICRKALRDKGIVMASHIKKLASLEDRDLSSKEDLYLLEEMPFPVLDQEKMKEMKAYILKMKEEGDSIGGLLQTIVTGLPVGLGDPWFSSLDSLLARAIFSIPAVKGLNFGASYQFAEMKGSEANDPMYFKQGEVVFQTNHNGGINGGISNGADLAFETLVKPTPSIAKKQHTVDIVKKKDAILEIQGRHDPAIIHRIREVIHATTALVLCDLLAQSYGQHWIRKEEMEWNMD